MHRAKHGAANQYVHTIDVIDVTSIDLGCPSAGIGLDATGGCGRGGSNDSKPDCER